MKKIKIDIIGTGNVGWHLSKAFSCAGVDVRSISSRTTDSLRSNSDLYIVSVSDSAIREVSAKLIDSIPSTAILAHTSGTTPMSVLDGMHEHVGVFYPLQTFTKGTELDYAEIPFFIEGCDKETEISLVNAAHMIGDKVFLADSKERKDLHIASVFSCNFVNYLWVVASRWLKDKGIPFDCQLPLIRETLKKAERLSPEKGQTGPAVRHDLPTIESHMEALKSNPGMSAIYELLTTAIMKDFKN